ncbi:hypothetical protein Nepgr_013663 [Nepenthes gracilis]|uniref:Uncharacterized protein n=1 Tax=Nepenthes gracilis TaxID=150966 RepID=A0AAD3SJN6_NEPGR|nr:hypothetical protein Nepgr_013663 [Nepenthes gracilis]
MSFMKRSGKWEVGEGSARGRTVVKRKGTAALQRDRSFGQGREEDGKRRKREARGYDMIGCRLLPRPRALSGEVHSACLSLGHHARFFGITIRAFSGRSAPCL